MAVGVARVPGATVCVYDFFSRPEFLNRSTSPGKCSCKDIEAYRPAYTCCSLSCRLTLPRSTCGTCTCICGLSSDSFQSASRLSQLALPVDAQMKIGSSHAYANVGRASTFDLESRCHVAAQGMWTSTDHEQHMPGSNSRLHFGDVWILAR